MTEEEAAKLTTIQLTKGTRDRLKGKRIAKRESFEEILARLLSLDDERLRQIMLAAKVEAEKR
jgi:hypothetical protein